MDLSPTYRRSRRLNCVGRQTKPRSPNGPPMRYLLIPFFGLSRLEHRSSPIAALLTLAVQNKVSWSAVLFPAYRTCNKPNHRRTRTFELAVFRVGLGTRNVAACSRNACTNLSRS